MLLGSTHRNNRFDSDMVWMTRGADAFFHVFLLITALRQMAVIKGASKTPVRDSVFALVGHCRDGGEYLTPLEFRHAVKVRTGFQCFQP